MALRIVFSQYNLHIDMISFFISLALLILGWIIYGSFVERVFSSSIKRKTPAYMNYDGVDYVPIGQRKALLIQFLKIAGLGPIFGVIMGAMCGPVASQSIK